MRTLSKRQTVSPGPLRGRSGRTLPFCFASLLVGLTLFALSSPRPGAAAAEDRLDAARRAAVEAEQLRAEWKESSTRQAAAKYLLALDAFREAGSRRDEADTLTRLGEVSLLLGDHRGALAHFGRALELYRAAGDSRGEAGALNGTGEAHAFAGENRQAIGLFRQALRAGRRAGDRVEEARALGNLGQAFYSLSDMGRALDFLKQALQSFDAADDPRGRAQTLRYLGYVHTDMSELPLALDYFKQSLPFWQEARDLRGEAQSTNAIGLVNSLLGEREQAIEFYARAERLFREMGDRQGLTTALNGQGELYASLSPERALRCHEEALRLSEETGELEGRIISHRYLGHTRRALAEAERAAGSEDRARENYERSLQHYQQSHSLCDALKDRRIEAYNLQDIGSVYDFLGDLHQALGYYERALHLGRQVRDPRGQSQALNSIGHVHERLGRAGAALVHYGRALPLARAAQDHVGEANTLFNIGRALRDRGDLSSASSHADAALRVVESLRAKVPGHTFRSSYLATVHNYFELSIDILMRRHARAPSAGFDVKALEVSELARARGLLDMLAESRAEIRRGAAPELLDEERRLRQALSAKSARQMALLSGGHTAEQAAAAEREMLDLTNRYEEVEAQIRRQSPRYAALRQPQPLSIGEIQGRVLDDQTVLLEYALGEERSYVWAVTRDGFTSRELPGRAAVAGAAQKVYGLLSERPGAGGEEELASASRELSRMVLSPVAELLGRRRIVVVADGALNYVPFQLLPEPSAGAEPLVARHEVVNAPSASVLGQLREEAGRRGRPAKTLAAFGDPVFLSNYALRREWGASGAEVAAIRRMEAEGWRSSLRGIEVDGDSFDPALIGPLYFAGVELANLREVATGEASFVADGFDATRERLRETDLSQFSILHFATHGLLNPHRPEDSGLMLSNVDREGRPQTGLVALRDIYGLHAPVELVVLSACRTALGKEVRGEGLIGLTRGFMYAGASSVVSSLWRVDDEATSELMKRFYANMLRGGMTPAAALGAAQNSIRQEPQWRSPHYWAAFTLQGEYRQVIRPAAAPAATLYGTKVFVAAALSALAACGLCGVWWLRRRRRGGVTA